MAKIDEKIDGLKAELKAAKKAGNDTKVASLTKRIEKAELGDLLQSLEQQGAHRSLPPLTPLLPLQTSARKTRSRTSRSATCRSS